MEVGSFFFEFEAVRTDLTEMLRAGRDEQRGGRVAAVAEWGGSGQDRFRGFNFISFSCSGRPCKTHDHVIGARRRRRSVQCQWYGALVLGL